MIGLIRFLDMFAGIGGFRAGLERAGSFTCVGHCEIDPHSNRSYDAIHHPKEGEWFCEDARKIEPETLPAFDLLCGGFPCQSFSMAGRRKGFAEPRGTLFFELARILESKRPPYFLFENVPGLLSHDKGRTLAAILSTLSDLGYCVEWQVLNSKDFGVPQSRRGYILSDILEENVPEKYYLSQKQTERLLYKSLEANREAASMTAGDSPKP